MVSILSRAGFGTNNHREDALRFIWVNLAFNSKFSGIDSSRGQSSVDCETGRPGPIEDDAFRVNIEKCGFS